MNILDILFPRRCLYCLKSGNYICNNCLRQFQPSLPECFYCRRLSNYYKSHVKCKNQFAHSLKNASYHRINNEKTISYATHLFQYNEAAKVLMKEAKFNGAFDIFGNIDELISLGIDRIQLPLSKEKSYTLLPVPQHSRRFIKRGFNHTRSVAESFRDSLNAKGYNVRVKPDIAIKRVNNKRQASLDKQKRISNTLNVYEVDRHRIKEIERIIMIDDVITTGSTLNSLGSSLKHTKKDLEVLSLCLFRGRPRY